MSFNLHQVDVDYHDNDYDDNDDNCVGQLLLVILMFDCLIDNCVDQLLPSHPW